MRRAELPKGERRLLDIIERCDFTGNGCYPTQKELTFLAGFKNHRYTNRLVKNLERKGFLAIEKRRRPGCKWSHNVYHVTHWNPQVRRGICNLRREWPRVRAEQEAESGSERTATAVEGADAQATPRSVPSNALPGRSHAENRCVRCGFEIRRSQVPQPRQRRLSAVPDLLCEGCRQFAEEVERKDEIIRRYAESETKRADELSGAFDSIRELGKANSALKRRITRAANEDAEAEAIEAICEDWRKDHPRASIAPGGRRWEVAKRALRLMRDDEQGAKHACLEALEGLRLRPYQEFEKRYATPGEGRVRRDDIEHALGDEVRIERCRAYARWARLSTPEQWWLFYETTSAVSELYWRRAVDAIPGGDGLEGERT